MDNVYAQSSLTAEAAQVSSLSNSLWSRPKVDSLLDARQPIANDADESTVSKVLREGEVFGKGLTLGIASGAKEALDDKGGTALRVAASVGTGALMTVMHGRAGM